MIKDKENEMNCERSWLRDCSKMYKMHYLGNNMGKCVEIENAVKNSDYGDASKKKWQKNVDAWATVYDETGSIYGK